MNTFCPKCDLTSDRRNLLPALRRHGTFRRRSDGRRVRRFRCLNCRSTFSTATHEPNYRQKKRHLNHAIMMDFVSSVTQRRSALRLNVNRKTIARRLRFLGEQARLQNAMDLAFGKPAEVVEFDELVDKEDSKCKPLSVPLIVESKSRRILGFEVARIPCGGPLAKKAVKLYGYRRDESSAARVRLLKSIADSLTGSPIIKTDSKAAYVDEIRSVLPHARHLTFKGKRGAIGGHGELKKIGFDPLFSLNHTCASLRANISRLVRKTWATTKRAERLADHIAIYVLFHNRVLI